MSDPFSIDDELLELAYPYALDAVSDSERSDIDRRLAGAPRATAGEFARIVRDVRETMAIESVLDAHAPPPMLKARVFGALEDPGGSKVTRIGAHRAKARSRSRAVLAAAAVVVVAIAVAVGVIVVQRGNDGEPIGPPTIAQVLQEKDNRVSSAAIAAGGTVTVTVSPRLDVAVVALDEVAPPPQGSVYQLWLVPANGSPVSAGTIGASTMPPPSGKLVTGVGTANSVAVSVEPGEGSPQPTTDPIVNVPLA